MRLMLSVVPFSELRTGVGDHVAILVNALVALAAILGIVGALGRNRYGDDLDRLRLHSDHTDFRRLGRRRPFFLPAGRQCEHCQHCGRGARNTEKSCRYPIDVHERPLLLRIDLPALAPG